MVNKKGGKHHKKLKKGGPENNIRSLDLLIKKEDQEYAVIKKLAGNCRLYATGIESEKDFLCSIPGSMRKRVWMGVGDIILISKRGYSDGKCDVLLVYTSEEVSMLSKKGYMKEPEKKLYDCDFEFDYQEKEEDEIEEQPEIDYPPSDSDDSLDIDDI